MAKRVVWIASAFLLLAFGTLCFVAASRVLLDMYPEVRFFFAIVLLAVAFAARRRARFVPRVLILSGAISLAIAYAHDLFIELGARHHWFQLFGDGWVFYGYIEGRERRYLAIPADVFRIIGFCFPLGLLLLALQRENKAI
ncbi:MAG: hypothetical protein ACJ8HQ_09475 [Chthoniobacterales bacterium]